MSVAFARRGAFWHTMARSALLGLLAAVAAIAFLTLEHELVGLLWGDDLPTGFFGLGWAAVPVILGAAVVVGLLRQWSGLEPPDPNFIDELVHGHVAPRQALSLVGIGLVSLVGAASVGPEAPIATAGAGLGSWLGERGGDEEETRILTGAGISGALGALMTFVFAGPLLALEVQEDREVGRYERLVPALVAATVALAVTYPVIGAPFVGLLRQDPPTIDVPSLLLAVPLGLLGAVLGVLSILVMALTGGLFRRLPGGPVGRAVTGGVVLLAVGAVTPLALFSGQDQLPVILDDPAALGFGLIAATLLGKVVVFGVSMRSGHFGGPIFPLLFLGASTGLLVHMAIPSVPLSLAVAAAAGGSTIAAVSMPFTVLVFLVVVFSLGIEGSIAPAVAIVSAYVAVHGTGLLDLLAARMGRQPTNPVVPMSQPDP